MAIDETIVKQFWEKRAASDKYCWAGLETDNANLVINATNKGDMILSLGCGDMAAEELIAASGRFVVGADMVRPATLRTHKNMIVHYGDIRKVRPPCVYNCVMIFGVANSFNDNDLLLIYEHANNALVEGGKCLIKHQSMIGEDYKEVDTEVEGMRYQAIYRPAMMDLRLVANIFDTPKMRMAYTNSHKRHPDSDFFLYTGYRRL